MASRQEEKERRRQERLAQEQAEANKAASRRRLQLVGGGVLALAAIAAIVIALVVGLGGGDSDDGPRSAASGEEGRQAAAAKLPEQVETDLKAAAKAANCTITNAKYEGQEHEDRQFAATDYKTNPPTSGNHNPDWYEDGIYDAGDTPELGKLVHTLEHGRIDIQYRKGTDAATAEQLEAFIGENDGYHMLMFENTTTMPYAVAASAWTHMIGCETMTPKVFDALRTFRDEYIDKGPEKIP